MNIDPISPYFTHIVALIAAASGGFFGSLSAFILASLKESKSVKREQYKGLLRTQFVIICQMNTLLSIKKQHLDPLRSDEQRFSKTPQFFYSPAHLKVDFKDLEMLVEKKNPELMQDIFLAEREYFSALEAIDVRNKFIEDNFYSDEVKVHEFDMDTGRSIVTMDVRMARQAKALCDCIYNSTDPAIVKLESTTENLRKFIKKHFRGKTALGYK